jgi:hypothetical protein
MTDMTHEHCSELLPDLLSGDLRAEDAVEIEAHLEGCDECRTELRGLEALRSELTPLSDFERSRLRRAVREALPEGAGFGPEKASLWRRAAPFLSAAAALLIVGFAITSIELGGSDEMTGAAGESSDTGGDTSSSDEAGSVEAGSAQEEEASGAGSTSDEITSGAAKPESGDTESLEAPAGAATGGRSSGRYPLFKVSQNLSAEKLESQARDGSTYRAAAQTLEPKDAERDRKELLATLSRRAETSGRSGSVLESCARSLIDGSRAELLPVFAAYGVLDSKRSLAIGFIEANRGVYNRYLIGVWTPPAPCEDPLLLRGQLR